MDKYYDFSKESKWYEHWEENGFFASTEEKIIKPYTLVMPPPNLTGNLHLGHALNNTLQDILIRYHKLKGYDVLWIPGLDHGGIATQNVVEKELSKQNIQRHVIGKEKFIEQVHKFTNEKKDNITNQLKRLGCACDWSKQQYTIDDKMGNLVTKSFVKMYEDGLIYKGKYIVNWCPRCATAISDDEVTHSENKGKMYYLKYKFVDSDFGSISSYACQYLTIATTRPETIFGDVAIAYNPTDERYIDFDGKELYVPIINRKIKLIKDNEVSKSLGTGLVKITPAHDRFDYDVGKRNNLDFIEIINEKCKICNTGTKYDGMDRFKCRKEIVTELSELELIEKIEDHKNNIGSCYRCQTIIEPYLSNQWFLKMDKLSALAQSAINSKDIELIPDYQEKIFNCWTNKTIDWCISRQIWWGHKLPIWYCDACNHTICSTEIPTKCNKCNGGLRRDESVLDTWFSSALWSFGVFENEEYEYHFPINVLITGKDILYFWVTRMIMFSLYFTGKIPFKQVLLHGVIRDEKGEKMSKSKGNVIDPLQIIDKYGADALRYTLIFNLPLGHDINMSMKTFDLGKAFCIKLWNAARYIFANTSNHNGTIFAGYGEFNKWILNKMELTNKKIEQYISEYNFSGALKELSDFFWNDFCNMYLELCKPTIDNKNTQMTLMYIFRKILIMYHPFAPFITETLWNKFEIKSIMTASWPKFDKYDILPETLYFIDLIGKIRMAKGKDKFNKIIIKSNEENCSLLFDNKKTLSKIVNIANIVVVIGDNDIKLLNRIND